MKRTFNLLTIINLTDIGLLDFAMSFLTRKLSQKCIEAAMIKDVPIERLPNLGRNQTEKIGRPREPEGA